MSVLIVLGTPFVLAVMSGAASLQPGTVVQVYEALLAERYHATPASQMSVKDVALAMPTVSGSSEEWRKLFDVVPQELRRAVSRQSPTKAHALEASVLPAGTRLVSARAVDAVFRRGAQENWEAYQRQFNTRGWLAFSDVLFTEDGLDALVYYESRCGGLCGEGGYAWLHRDSRSSRWTIAKRIIKWMS
jgi:hypothetical protein